MWLQIVALPVICKLTNKVPTHRVGHTILIDGPLFTITCGCPVASHRIEAERLLFILKKMEVRYQQHVQLMIFTDCLPVLGVASNFVIFGT